MVGGASVFYCEGVRFSIRKNGKMSATISTEFDLLGVNADRASIPFGSSHAESSRGTASSDTDVARATDRDPPVKASCRTERSQRQRQTFASTNETCRPLNTIGFVTE